MYSKAWMAVGLGIVLGSLFFSSGCGLFSNQCQSCGNCGTCASGNSSGVPAGATVPTASGNPGWRPVIGGAPTP